MKADLIRDPADWARDWGYISPRRAKNLAAKLNDLAGRIEGAMWQDEGAEAWVKEIRRIARKLDVPKTREKP